MRVLHIVSIILYLEISLAREEWVDPHDMNIGMKHTKQTNPTNGDWKEHCDKFYKDNSSYLRKVVGTIINMAKFDRNSDVYKGQMNIELTTQDYDFLRKFVTSENLDEYSLRRLNTVLDSSLQQSIFDTAIFTFGEYVYLSLYNAHTAIIFAVLGSLFIIWKLEPHKYEMKTLFKIVFPLLYVSDFGLRYIALIEEVEIDKFMTYKHYEKCDPAQMGWFDWFYDKLTGSCKHDEKAYLLSQRAAIHIITPMKVLSQQFDVVVPIFKHFGEGFGKFMWALVEDVPWYVKPFVALLAFILVIIFILMVGSSVLKISPRFNLFYLLQFEFLHTQPNRPQIGGDHVSGQNLTMLLDRLSSGSANSISGQRSNNSITYKTKKKGKENTRKRVPYPFYTETKKINASPDEANTKSLFAENSEATQSQQNVQVPDNEANNLSIQYSGETQSQRNVQDPENEVNNLSIQYSGETQSQQNMQGTENEANNLSIQESEETQSQQNVQGTGNELNNFNLSRSLQEIALRSERNCNLVRLMQEVD